MSTGLKASGIRRHWLPTRTDLEDAASHILALAVCGLLWVITGLLMVAEKICRDRADPASE